MTTFNGRIATEFKKLPNCNPDFIYLDGPDQFNVISNIMVLTLDIKTWCQCHVTF